MPVRLFSVDEANGLLAPLDEIVEHAQSLLSDMRHVRDQLVDLRIVWGERILDPACADHAEYQRYREEFSRLEGEVQKATDQVAQLGAELKDVENGLVDFCTHRGEEVVYLCWRKGEHRIQWWHPVDGGFAARQPLDQL